MAQFRQHIVSPRQDVLDIAWIYRNCTDPYSEIARHVNANIGGWLDELERLTPNISGHEMTREKIGRIPDSEIFGDRVIRYRGNDSTLRGLWVLDPEWVKYDIGSDAILYVNEEYFDISFDVFKPENWIDNSLPVKCDKRMIRYFQIQRKTENIGIYAKGAARHDKTFLESDRLTRLEKVVRYSSEKEKERSEVLRANGVNTPPIIAYYIGPVEQFLFEREIVGDNQGEFWKTNPELAVDLDSFMLATIARLGFFKYGFCDEDDKIFDGRRLYLVDVEDVRFRAELEELDNETRRKIILYNLEDVLPVYATYALADLDLRQKYIQRFFYYAGLGEIKEKEMERFCNLNAATGI